VLQASKPRPKRLFQQNNRRMTLLANVNWDQLIQKVFSEDSTTKTKVKSIIRDSNRTTRLNMSTKTSWARKSIVTGSTARWPNATTALTTAHSQIWPHSKAISRKDSNKPPATPKRISKNSWIARRESKPKINGTACLPAWMETKASGTPSVPPASRTRAATLWDPRGWLQCRCTRPAQSTSWH